MEGDIECEDFKEKLDNFLGYLERVGDVTDLNGAPLDSMNWDRGLVITPYDSSLSHDQIRNEIRTASRIYDIHNFKLKIQLHKS